ncbi:hypothetical protein TSOC_002195 [Tetrabaena socialis]|uniref:Pherophorin domain-containing protein n=1 Tax=Tetrabaena socialis TaxID=47790 RepID=A0A2J8AES1_9CHLO|nr:hypothetical protein TSOC_002195 [Tetrabaena socialis]|eukprot:PNH11002.1 hypothetical protein TSOC_002195 [Tetrabaena socialis]
MLFKAAKCDSDVSHSSIVVSVARLEASTLCWVTDSAPATCDASAKCCTAAAARQLDTLQVLAGPRCLAANIANITVNGRLWGSTFDTDGSTGLLSVSGLSAAPAADPKRPRHTICVALTGRGVCNTAAGFCRGVGGCNMLAADKAGSCCPMSRAPVNAQLSNSSRRYTCDNLNAKAALRKALAKQVADSYSSALDVRPATIDVLGNACTQTNSLVLLLRLSGGGPNLWTMVMQRSAAILAAVIADTDIQQLQPRG